jgi:hypothetical protein
MIDARNAVLLCSAMILGGENGSAVRRQSGIGGSTYSVRGRGAAKWPAVTQASRLAWSGHLFVAGR